MRRQRPCGSDTESNADDLMLNETNDFAACVPPPLAKRLKVKGQIRVEEQTAPEKLCPSCKQLLPSSRYEAHVAKCLHLKFSREGHLEEVLCQICQKDISHLNSVQRNQHANECIDKPKQSSISIYSTGGKVQDCPICGQASKTPAARQRHLKKCATKNKISTSVLLQKVNEQERERLAMAEAGVVPVPRPPPPKRVKKSVVKSASEASSSSLKPPEEKPAEASKDAFSILMSPSKKIPARRKKPKLLTKPSRLLEQSSEESQRKIAQKMSAIISCEPHVTPASPKSQLCLFQSSLGSESESLWKRADLQNDNFFVNQLKPHVREHSSLHSPQSFHNKTMDGNTTIVASTQTAVLLAELAANRTFSLEMTQKADQKSHLDLHNMTGFCVDSTTDDDDDDADVPQMRAAPFASMVNNPILSDVSFKCHNSAMIYAHKFVLCCRLPSSVWKDLGKKDVIDVNASEDVTKQFLSFLYTGTKPILSLELSALAVRFGVKELQSERASSIDMSVVLEQALKSDSDDSEEETEKEEPDLYDLAMSQRNLRTASSVQDETEEDVVEGEEHDTSDDQLDFDAAVALLVEADSGVENVIEHKSGNMEEGLDDKNDCWMENDENKDVINEDEERDTNVEIVAQNERHQDNRSTAESESAQDSVTISDDDLDDIPYDMDTNSSVHDTMDDHGGRLQRSSLHSSSEDMFADSKLEQTQTNVVDLTAEASPLSLPTTPDLFATEKIERTQRLVHDISNMSSSDAEIDSSPTFTSQMTLCLESRLARMKKIPEKTTEEVKKTVSSRGNDDEMDSILESKLPCEEHNSKKTSNSAEEAVPCEMEEIHDENTPPQVPALEDEKIQDDVWDDFDNDYAFDNLLANTSMTLNQSFKTPSKAAYDPPTDVDTDVSLLQSTEKTKKGTKEPTIPSPFTPMPSYNDMKTPQLKKEIQKYGVRAMPKKKMKQVLVNIYNETHQYETDSDVDEDLVKVAQSKDSSKSATDSSEEMSDLPEESILIEDQESKKLSKRDAAAKKQEIWKYIRSHDDIYSKVLQYEPLEFEALHKEIKVLGPIGAAVLMDALDDMCVQFTTRSKPGNRHVRKRKKKSS